MTDIYLGDIGVEFRVDTESTITSATTISVEMKLPDGALQTWSATTYDETTLTFTGTSTMFTSTEPAGDWIGQAFIVLGAASSIQIHGAPFIIKVGEP